MNYNDISDNGIAHIATALQTNFYSKEDQSVSFCPSVLSQRISVLFSH